METSVLIVFASDCLLVVHHKTPFGISQDNSLENLESLCPSCHRKKETLVQEYLRSAQIEGREAYLKRLATSHRKIDFDVNQMILDYERLLSEGKWMVMSELGRKYGVSKSAIHYWLKKRKALVIFKASSIKYGEVVKIERLTRIERRWNISVKKTECFFANNALVHNCRYSLQLGVYGLMLVSRSKEGKTKGVEASKDKQFVVRTPEPWMVEYQQWYLNLYPDESIVYDGELCADCDDSTSSDVTRSDTPKKFVVYDVLMFNGEDIRYFDLLDRKALYTDMIREFRDEGMLKLECVESYDTVEVFTLEDLNAILKSLEGVTKEGYVLKLGDTKYSGMLGWKIKLEDTGDAFIADFHEEKKHKLGKVTKTGRVGTVKLVQLQEKRSVTVCWVGLPEGFRCKMDDEVRKDALLGRVVEFKHYGWDGKKFRFPDFIEFRTDKSAHECTFQEV